MLNFEADYTTSGHTASTGVSQMDKIILREWLLAVAVVVV